MWKDGIWKSVGYEWRRVSKGYGMVAVEQDVELRVVGSKLRLCHSFVYNYYVTLSNKSLLLTLCIVKHTTGETTESLEYVNYIPSSIFCYVSKGETN